MAFKMFSAIVALILVALPQGAAASSDKGMVSAFELSPATYNVTFDLPPEVREKYKMLSQPTEVQGTLRSRFSVSVGGSRIRVRLSNELGSVPLHIGGASIAIAANGISAQPGSMQRLTFGGKHEIVIQPGAPALSDTVQLAVASGQNLVASIFVSQAIPLSPLGGTTLLQTGGDDVMVDELTGAKPLVGRPLVTSVLVETARRRTVIVALGDSITDASRMEPSTPHGWVSTLARRLDVSGNRASAVSAGIGGNRVLRSSWGPSALARLDRDVFAVPGVSHVILLEGINDIGFSGKSMTGTEPQLDLEELLQGYRQIAIRAHAKGLKIYIGTLPPFRGAPYFSEGKEQLRLAANAWIRANKEFDGAIDFEAALRDPQQPDRLLKLFDSGDHLHPSDEGYRAMGEAVPLSLFGH